MITEEKKQKIREICRTVNYKEINIEAWYQELQDNKNRTDDEELVFSDMFDMRKHCNEFLEKFPNDVLKALADKCNYNLKNKYYDWDSRPIHMWEWTFKCEYLPNHLAEDFINGWRISTIWLGLDHEFFKSDFPIIFETMIFADNENVKEDEALDFFQRRYSYLPQAERGHKLACRYVRRRTYGV